MLPSLFCDICGAANRPQALYCFACGQPLQHSRNATATGLLAGQRGQVATLNRRYRVLELLGQGGFGAVYKVADTQLGNRLLAIKEMSQSGLKPQELAGAAEAFKREAHLLANLAHPNLPHIYERFQEQGRWYLVMDYIEGKTLEELLTAHQRYPIDKALPLALQVCSVLDYLHTRQPPIVFRDLKPANIMLTPVGHIYLIDFGIARHFKPGQAKDTATLGSTGYAAPEQYGRAQSTPRSDLYGLGATLHQLLSGHDPADSPFHFAPLQLRGHPALAGLEVLIMQMLEIDSSKRPSDAAEVKQKLQAISKQYALMPTHSLPGNPPPGYGPATTAPKNAPAAGVPRPQSNTLLTCSGHSSRLTALSWSPNGSFIASASYDKTVRIWSAANGQNLLTYRGHSDRVHSVSWSPNGARLASASDDGTAQVWDAVSGKRLLTFKGHAGKVTSLSWSPDGTRVASASSDKTVQVWDSATGRSLFTQRGHSAAITCVAWSPDGKYIASAGLDKSIHIWEWTKDSKRNFLTAFLFSVRDLYTYRGHSQRVNALAWSPNRPTSSAVSGPRIASVSSDKSVQVWTITNGKVSFSYRNPSAAINAVAWSPDGRHLAFASNDKTVQVWDLLTRSSNSSYRGHSAYVTAVAWSPDGRRLASASVDRTLQVWRV